MGLGGFDEGRIEFQRAPEIGHRLLLTAPVKLLLGV